jgi:hypothetical protein
MKPMMQSKTNAEYRVILVGVHCFSTTLEDTLPDSDTSERLECVVTPPGGNSITFDLGTWQPKASRRIGLVLYEGEESNVRIELRPWMKPDAVGSEHPNIGSLYSHRSLTFSVEMDPFKKGPHYSVCYEGKNSQGQRKFIMSSRGKYGVVLEAIHSGGVER